MLINFKFMRKLIKHLTKALTVVELNLYYKREEKSLFSESKKLSTSRSNN